MELKGVSTKELSEELTKREGIQVIELSPEELAKIEIGPIKCELTGPVQIIVNYD